MKRFGNFLLTLLLTGALATIEGLVTGITSLEQTPLITGLFYIGSFAVIAATFFIGSRFRFLGEKTNMFKKTKNEFSKRNVGVIIGGFLLASILSFVYSLITKGEPTLNDQAILEIIKNLSFLKTFVWICVIAPICEEFLFRGLFFNGVFRDKQEEQISLKMDILGVIVTSLLFGAVHLSADLLSFLLYFSMGVILCTVYLLTRSLKSSIIVHFLNNFISLIGMLFL